MTSQPDLPIAEFGMIWDKETEFAQLHPRARRKLLTQSA